MKNIWTRYLEPISVEETERKPFLQQLQKFEEHSHFHVRELPVAEAVEEPFEVVSEILQDMMGDSIVSDERVETVETVETVDNSVNEIELIQESIPGPSSELVSAPVPELVSESSLEIPLIEVEDEIPQSIELEVPAAMEDVVTVVEGESSELLGEVTEVAEVTEVVPDDIEVVEYVGEGTEVMCWVAKSHKGHEMRLNTYPDDVVRLIEYGAGELLLKYSITGEDIEDTPVVSVVEAKDIIDEDNAMTEDLYKDAPELKWVNK